MEILLLPGVRREIVHRLFTVELELIRKGNFLCNEVSAEECHALRGAKFAQGR
jgi:hypothetical protein